VKAYDTCGGSGRNAILVCPGDSALGTNIVLFKKDVSQYLGTNTIEVAYSYTGTASWRADVPPALAEWEGWSCSAGWFSSETKSYQFTNAGPNVTTCGNSVCDAGETFQSCPADCPEVTAPKCGDFYCNGQETCSTCPGDCGVCSVVPACGDANCNGFETCSTCPGDCGVCPVVKPAQAQDNTLLYAGIAFIVVVGSGAMILSKKKR
jgi:hypothetical protein